MKNTRDINEPVWQKFCYDWIKFKIPKHNFKENVETFYNVGSEKNWIKSALYEKEYNSVLAHWVDVKKPEFFDEEFEENLPENRRSNTELVTEKTTFSEKCKTVLKVSHWKLVLLVILK